MQIQLKDAVGFGTTLIAVGIAWGYQQMRINALEGEVERLNMVERVHKIELWIAGWEARWPQYAVELRNATRE